ncbi:MAG TPA: FtsK/SpoIIIE domain-containing protein, partial [Acidimicrobiales bacterium]|nr:FtsK/SpoIIIE domain-containing protein [Acidimicrobiales bacterium]
MRLNLRLTNPDSGRRDHVVLTTEPDALVDDVVRALNTIQPGPLFVRGYPLAGHGQLSSSVLRDGDVVSVAHPGPSPGRAGFQLVAVAGPADGTRWVLPPGATVVGRESTAAVSIDDPELSRQHLRVTVAPEACTVEDLGSLNGTRVDGRAIDGPTPVGAGAVIGAGQTTLELRPAARLGADLRPDGAGGLTFNRPARIRPAPREVKVSLPAPPREREPHPFPWIQVIAPVVLSLVLAGVLRRPEFLLFSLMGPVLAVSNTISYRRRDAARSGEEQARYTKELEEARARIALAVAEEAAAAREQFPDPLNLAEVATTPAARLWERRNHDADAGLVRVGVAQRPASVVVTARGADAPPETPMLDKVPITVDLAAAGVLGVAGPEPQTRAVARWLVAQLATLRSPRDLRLVVLTDAKAGPDWEWVRWLPHVRSDDPGAPVAAVGNDPATREDRVRELVAILDGRLATVREHGRARFSPTMVVVLDGVRGLRSVPGLTRILKAGPAVGIVAIDLDIDVSRLAEEGTAQLVLDPRCLSRAALDVEGADPVADVAVDQVDAAWADEVARALAAFRDGGADDDESSLPSSVRYLDLVDISLDSPADVIERWASGGHSTEALVGVSADGPFYLDLRRDGPHALVAGTTGSGKSELLQTVVVSLALANTPSALNFVLIDYKGASAFADCADLPHTVGLVTNLDGHLTERALASLDAELGRREQVLRDLKVPDLDAAWERRPREAALAHLARLVLVIDEFAELVHELPEFVTGLIRIARVGRSLGIHLILATQRPAGVVSSEMRANTGLRVALRMEGKHDSTEVLEAPYAADISRSTPGRAFVRTGGRVGFVEFQTARVAGRCRAGGDAPAPRVDPVSWRHLGYALLGGSDA